MDTYWLIVGVLYFIKIYYDEIRYDLINMKTNVIVLIGEICKLLIR